MGQELLFARSTTSQLAPTRKPMSTVIHIANDTIYYNYWLSLQIRPAKGKQYCKGLAQNLYFDPNNPTFETNAPGMDEQ